MGLIEKRAAEEIKQKWTSGWEKRVHDAIQTPVPIEIRFDTLVKDGEAGYAVDAFEKVFVNAMEMGFKELCKDPMGKEAVAGTLKKIVIQNVESKSSGSSWAAFSGGTLTLDHGLVNVDYAHERAEGLVKHLSNSL